MAFTITYVIGKSIYINMTNRCTNNCDFCVRNNPEGIDPRYDLWLDREPLLEEIVDDIRKHHLDQFEEIVFCGYGEPLLRAYEIFEVCKQIRKISSISIRINTNGQANMYFKEDITEYMEGLIDICSVSLNASNAIGYQKHCQSDFGEDAFFGIIEFAKKCKKYVPKVLFSVVDVMEKQEIELCREIAKECGVEFRIREIIK